MKAIKKLKKLNKLLTELVKLVFLTDALLISLKCLISTLM